MTDNYRFFGQRKTDSVSRPASAIEALRQSFWNLQVFVFSHAPIIGSALRVLQDWHRGLQTSPAQFKRWQELHVLNGCCWLNHSDGASIMLSLHCGPHVVHPVLAVLRWSQERYREPSKKIKKGGQGTAVRLQEVHSDRPRERLYQGFWTQSLRWKFEILNKSEQKSSQLGLRYRQAGFQGTSTCLTTTKTPSHSQVRRHSHMAGCVSVLPCAAQALFPL